MSVLIKKYHFQRLLESQSLYQPTYEVTNKYLRKLLSLQSLLLFTTGFVCAAEYLVNSTVVIGFAYLFHIYVDTLRATMIPM